MIGIGIRKRLLWVFFSSVPSSTDSCGVSFSPLTLECSFYAVFSVRRYKTMWKSEREQQKRPKCSRNLFMNRSRKKTINGFFLFSEKKLRKKSFVKHTIKNYPTIITIFEVVFPSSKWPIKPNNWKLFPKPSTYKSNWAIYGFFSSIPSHFLFIFLYTVSILFSCTSYEHNE